MNAMEKIQELNKCADRHRAIHDNRQRIEYRVLVAVLTFYAGSTWAILKHDSVILPFAVKLTVSAGYFILATITSAFLRRLHFANQVNIAIAENYETEIIQLLELTKNPIPKGFQKTDYDKVRPLKFPISNWGWQTVITLCFALIGLLMVWSK